MRVWLVALPLALAAVGCGGGDPLVGKWVETNPGVTSERSLEFTGDGRLLESTMFSNREPVAESWVIRKKTETSLLVTNAAGRDRTLKVTLLGGTLTLTDEGTGESVRYMRREGQ